MDISAIKKRLEQLQTSNTRTSNLWKPQPGKQVVRVVPYQFNKENPFQEIFFHYDLGGKTYLSPITYGRPDPIEEFAQKLRSSGNKDDYQIARKLMAKMRTFAPVVVRGEESEGVRFWGFGKTVYQELLSVIADPDYGDITDAMNGRDITVEFVSAEDAGKSFPVTTIRVKPNQSPVTEDDKLLDKIINEQPNIQEMYAEKTYEELTEILNTWLTPSEDEEGKEVDGMSVTNEVLSKKTVKDTSEAFDQLFNK
tara:strand:- start:744 stop:1502 length:759 start_codon:yes stop_codon:yes gene_type:complete